MSAPGTKVISRGAPASSSPSLDTGRCFAAGITERGPVDTVIGPLRSLEEVVAETGDRIASAYIYDFADVFFREGGSELFIARAVGPAPVTATVNLKGASEDTLTVKAVSPGAWANDLDIVVTAESGNFILTVKLDGVVVETSPVLATNTEAVAWAANSEYIRLADLAKAIPSRRPKNSPPAPTTRGASPTPSAKPRWRCSRRISALARSATPVPRPPRSMPLSQNTPRAMTGSPSVTWPTPRPSPRSRALRLPTEGCHRRAISPCLHPGLSFRASLPARPALCPTRRCRLA